MEVWITSDVGLPPVREFDVSFRLSEMASAVLSDPPPREDKQLTMPAMFQQSVPGRLAGDEDVNPGVPGPDACGSIPSCAKWPVNGRWSGMA